MIGADTGFRGATTDVNVGQVDLSFTLKDVHSWSSVTKFALFCPRYLQIQRCIDWPRH